MYVQTWTTSGTAGTGVHIVTNSLEIRDGMLNDKPYVAITSFITKAVILRGPTRDTKSEAMESFIDKVLTTSKQWREKIESQRARYIEVVERGET
jgi:hypothetical protein